jgi:TP901 family phage tail tape measure protein
VVAGYFEIEYIFLLQDKFSTVAKTISTSIGKLRSDINNLNNGLEASSKQTAKLTAGMKRLKSPLDQATKGLKGYGREVKASKRYSQDLNATINKLSQSLYRVGAAMSGAITVPVTAAAYGSSRAYLGLEKEFVGLQRKTGASRSDVLSYLPNILKSTVTDRFGNKLGGAFNSADLMQMMTGFAGAGIGGHLTNTTDRMKFLQGFAEVAKKGQLALDIPNTDEMEKFSKLIVKLGDLKSPKQFEDILDMLNAIADTGVAKERDIVSAMQSKGISDALTYFGDQDFSTKISKMFAMQEAALSLGMSPLKGASFTQALISRFVTKDKELPESVRKEFFSDPMKALIGFLRASEKKTGFERINMLKGVLGSEYSAKGAALSTGSVISTLEKRLKWIETVKDKGVEATFDQFGISNFRVANAFGLTLESLGMQLDLFKNNLSNIGITLFELIGPTIGKLLVAFNKAAPHIIDFINKHPFISKVALGFTALAAAMGPLLLLLGSIGQLAVSFTILKELGALASITSWFAGVSTTITTAITGFFASPLLIAGVIAAIAGAKVIEGAASVVAKDDAIWEATMKALGTSLKNQAGRFYRFLEDAVEDVGNALIAINKYNPARILHEAIDTLFKQIGDMLNNLGKNLAFSGMEWILSGLTGEDKSAYKETMQLTHPNRYGLPGDYYGGGVPNASQATNNFYISPTTGVTKTGQRPIGVKPLDYGVNFIGNPNKVGKTDASK